MPNLTNNLTNAFSKWIVGTFSETVACTPLDLQILEDRVLYSAGPLPLDLINQNDAVHADFVQGDLDSNELFNSIDSQFDFVANAVEAYQLEDLEQVFSAGLLASPSSSNELVLVDTSVDGYQQLVDDLFSSQTTDRNTEVIFLDSRTDGVRQISDALNKRSNLNAIHLVSHGSDGVLELGNARLDSSSLATYEDEIASWKNSLATDADFLIYGCNVAESASGEQFVDQISVLLQADVSASADTTGHSSLGGDWSFEYQVGEIETMMAFSTSIQSDWLGSLALYEMTGEDVVNSGSASRAIAADSEGRVTQVFTSDALAGALGNDIFMVQFDVDGTQLGPPQKVNTGDTLGDQHNASIAMNDDGDFVVVWTSEDLIGDLSVKGKIFSTTGPSVDFEVGDQALLLGGLPTIPSPVPVGVAPFSAITEASNASVAMNASGDFIVTWEGGGTEDNEGIYAQRFQLDGVAVDEMAFIVNGTVQVGYQGSPDVAINATGEFIVGWDTTINETTESKGYIAVFDSSRNELIADEAQFEFASAYFANISVDIDDSLNLAVAATGDATFDWPGVITKNISIASLEYDGTGAWTTTNASPHNLSGSMGDQVNASIAIVDSEVIVTWEGEETLGSDTVGVFYAAYNLDLTTQLQAETHVTTADGPLQTSASITKFHGGREWAIGWLDSSLGYQNLIGNDLPNGTDGTVNVIQFDSYTFNSSDFGYEDDNGVYADNDPFTSIEITVLPSEGDLIYQGSAVAINDVLLISEIVAGELQYVPEFGYVGTDTGLTFIVSDGFESASSANTLDVEVASLTNATPTNLSSGVQFNTDGGNDAYFLTQDTGFLNGLDDFTVEVSFASSNTNSAALISYQTTDAPDGSLYHNDFLIQYNLGGTISVFLPGGSGASDINNLGGLDYSTLMDGSQHSIAFSFKSSSGDWKLFVDGTITDQGTSTLFQNSELNGGGALVIGQEQDSPNADFDPTAAFSGTIFDVRIWDNDFNDPGDLLFLDQKVDPTNLPDELLADWQFEGLVGGTNVVNIVDAGNPLVLNHAVDAGFNTGNATTQLSVSENASNGTIVGTVIPTDINLPESFTFSLADDASGRFDIDSSTGEITVLDGSELNFENFTSHSIDVDVTDGGGLTYSQSIIINLIDVNDAPTASNNGMTINLGSSSNIITTAMLNETDADAGDSGSSMVYTVTAIPSNGELLKSGSVLSAGETFTQDDVDNNRITYNHSAGTLVDDGFDFSLSDGEFAVTGTFAINIENQAPTIATNETLTVVEGGTVTISNTNLNEGDPDDSGAGLTYTIGTTVANGTLFLNTTALDNGDSFSQADIDSGFVTYEHNGNETTGDSFTFTLADGGEDSVGTAAGTFLFDVTPVNDAPTFGPNTPATFDEGSTGNVIDDAYLKESDPDDDGAELTYTLTSDVSFGNLRLNGSLLEINDTFTQADVIADNLTYDHDGTDPGVSPTDSFNFTFEDGGEDGVPTGVGSFTINITPIDDVPVANDDSFNTPEDTIHSTGNLLTNDTDEEGDSLLVVEYTQAANGTVALNSDGSFTYTPDSNFNGIDTFDYTMVQSQNGLVHHWGMNGDGVDLIGGVTSDVDGATPIASDNGTGLQFDEVDDFVGIEGVELNSNFTISFDFKIDGNSGNSFQYLYSQGTIQTSNSLNIYVGEDSSGAPGILKTAIFDGNDPTNAANRDALNIDISSLIGDTSWHEYALVVEQGVGVKVYIDGVQQSNSTHSEDGAVINQDIFLGKRNDSNVNRYFGGALDSLQVFDQALSDSEIADPAKGLFTATATMTVDPENDIPVAHDNIYGVSVGGTLSVGLEQGLLYNDSDVDGDSLAVTIITAPPTNGILIFGTDGTFTYTHTALNADPDSFEYQVSDGNGGFATATVQIHVDDLGFIPTDEFRVNDPSGANQNTHQANSTHTDSAVATAANGDYVVTWTSYAGGEENVFLQRYDFSGNRIGDPIDVSADLTDGDNHHASTAMADDGRFVVVWSNEFTTSSNDGTAGSVYFQQFNADGTANGSTNRVTDAGFSTGEQVSPDVSMNASGQFAITWDGEGAGGIHNVFLNMFGADGTSITSGPQKMNGPGLGGGFEYNASVVISDDGTVFAAWDDGNLLHGKVFDSAGNPGPEFIPPDVSYVVSLSHSSLDINDAGLLAMAYQVEVDDGMGGTNLESRLQILDMSDPVVFLSPAGNQTLSGSQVNPSVSFGDDGTLIMTWEGEGPGDTSGVFARKFRIEFNSEGDPYAEALGDEFLVNQSIPGDQEGASVSAIDSENFVVVWSGNGTGDSNGIFARQFGNQNELTISGQVVLDVNGDSDLADSEDVSSAAVSLYRDGGDGVISADDIQIRSEVLTDSNGDYSFTGLASESTYWVVVDSKTIAPDDFNSGFGIGDVWAEQTYGDSGSKFGGLTAGVSDDASTLLTAQHVSQVDLGNSNYTDVDFGFSFNVVTNTLGGNFDDDDLFSNRTIQGTLRQFIANANAVEDENVMRFVPGVAPSETDGSHAWWEIAVSQALPAILDNETVIDGRAYDSADGVTRLNSNTMVHTSLLGADGIAGTGDEFVGVGTDGVAGTGDEMTLAGVEGPELEIRAVAIVGNGLEVHGEDVEIAHLAIHGFGQSGVNSGNIFVGTTADDIHIHDNIIGSEAGDYSIPPTALTSIHGITVSSADDGVIEDNLIAFHNESGIRIVGANGGSDNVEGWTIRGNEVFQNALTNSFRSGIDVLRSEDILISGNFIGANAGFGIDTYDSVGDISISDNTIAANGTSTSRSGIRLFGNDNIVEHNIVAGNNGAGVNVVSDYVDGSRSFVASTNNLISQNSFFNNAGVAIDHMSQSGGSSAFNSGDGVSDNATASDTNAGNDGVDHPVLAEAYVDGSGLNIFGSLDTLANFDRVEIYLGNPGTGDSLMGAVYGEGETYLGTVDLSDFVTLSAGGDFHAILDPPTGGWPTQLTTGGMVTTIGIQANGNTSEFSNNVGTNDIPDASASEINLDEDDIHVFSVTDFEFVDSDDPTFDHIIVDTMPTDGTLYLSGLAIDSIQIPVTVSRTNIVNGALTFEPDPDENGSTYATFEFRVNDGTSTGSSATMTVNVDPINDAPVANDDSYSTPEDTLRDVLSSVLDNDVDIDHSQSDLDASVVVEPSNGEVTMKKDGTFKYTPDDDFFGIDTFKYRVVDKGGEFDEALVSINVLPINDAPEFDDSTPSKVFVMENRFNVIQFVASDAESDPFAFSLATGMTDDNSLFAIHPTSGQLVFRSPPDFENPGGLSDDGSYDVNVEVTDIHGDTSIHTIEIKLVDEAEAPVANDDFVNLNEGASKIIDVTINDTDPDDNFNKKFSTVTIVSGPASGNAFVNPQGNIVYIHNGDEIFSDAITYEIVDKTGLTDTATITIGINSIEDVTQVHDDFLGRVGAEEQLIVSANVLLANDTDGDSVLSYHDIVLISQPDRGFVEIVDGKLVFTPDADAASGFDSFEYHVVSNGVTSESAKVVVQIGQPFVRPTQEDTEPEIDEEAPDSTDDPTAPPETDKPGSSTVPFDEPKSDTGSSDNTNAAFFDDDSELQTDLETSDFKVNYVGATYAFASRFDDLSNANLAGIWVSKDPVAVTQFETNMFAGLIWDDHDAANHELIANKLQLGVSEIAASAASFLTVGYLAWIIRGGVLLTTFMSSIPAWSSFDINSVLDTEGNESIEQMVDL